MDPATLYTEIHNLQCWDNVPWEDILQRATTLKNVPPQCVTGFAQLIALTARTINTAAESGDSQRETAAWKLMLALPAMIAHRPTESRAGKKGQGKATLTNIILARLKQAYLGQWSDLLAQIEYPSDQPKQTRTQTQIDQDTVKQIQQALEEKEVARALKALHGPLQLADDAQITQELPQLFMKVGPPLPQYPYNPDAAIAEEITKHICHYLLHPPKHKASGPAGDRYEHYATTGHSPETAAELAKAMLRLAYGKVPDDVLNAYASAQLVPLLKPTGRIRPIACGTAIRRIITASVAKAITPTIAPTICTHQYATARAAGAEEIHKLIQIVLEQDPNRALISLDMSAAFNDISPAEALHQNARHTPEHDPLFRTWLRARPTYYCRMTQGKNMEVHPKNGVPMGCPLAALSFCYTLHVALAQIEQILQTHDPNARVLAYMDDIYIITNHHHIDTAVQAARSATHALGLTLNQEKTTV
jgi:hypothetical protein